MKETEMYQQLLDEGYSEYSLECFVGEGWTIESLFHYYMQNGMLP